MSGPERGAEHPDHGSEQVTEDELHAWLDDRLPPGRRVEVDAWLAANPDAGARARALAAQRALLRTAMRPWAEEAVPPRLRVAALVAARRRAARDGWRQAAAVVLLLGLGGSAGWLGHARFAPTPAPIVVAAAVRPMVTEAIAAHRVFSVDAGRPVEVAAAQEALLVRWLTNRLGRPIAAPDLAGQGLRLMGGRLLPGGAGDPAAQLMYEDAQGVRVTVYLRADRAGEGATEFRHAESTVQGRAQGTAAFWWVDRGFGYAVAAAGLDRAALLDVAVAVHRAFDAPAPPRAAPTPGRDL